MRTLCLPLFLLILGATIPRPSSACSCAEPPPPLEALERYDAVFAARILTVDPVYGGDGGTYPHAIDYTAQILAVWKGGDDPMLELVSDDPAMCGMWLDQGEEYLIYTYWAGPAHERYSVSNCYRLFRLEDAGDDLAALGEPIFVATEPSRWGAIKAWYE